MSPTREFLGRAARRGVRFELEKGRDVRAVFVQPCCPGHTVAIISEAAGRLDDLAAHVKAAKARGDRFLASLARRIAE